MPWIGFDLDGTLAFDAAGAAWGPPGPPIPATIEILKTYLSLGLEVRIVTARVAHAADIAEQSQAEIEAWCQEHIGQVLPITSQKDPSMWLLYDDRAVQVEKNTGRVFEDILTSAHTIANAEYDLSDDPWDIIERIKAALGSPVERRSAPRSATT